MSLTPIGDLGIALKADIDDYQKSMATASDITAGVTGTIRSLGSAVRGMGLAMTVGAGIAGAALVSLTQKAEQVSSAFREVDTLVQGSSDAQEKYGELVSDLNTQFGLQADKMEVIEGLYQSISAGVDQSVEAQREFLSTAAELAVVGRVELGTAVDVLSTVMNTYGYEASEAENISESLFQTVQFGKTRLEELAPVLGRVAALGSNLGIQIDEIGASMGVLTRTGFGARVAATGLRNIFRAMLKPSEQMQETLFQIASEQDFFASSFESSSDKIKGIASDFREASDAVEKFTQKQEEARAMQEGASTAIQEARLKISAIEEDRLDQLPELTSEQVKEAESVEELESVIESYQFKVNKARLQEKKFRKEKEEAQVQMEEEKSSIADLIASRGDLQGGIGQLILENQDFVDTMVDIKERINETDTSMSDMFPRTRALQGALALVGEEGQMLTEIYKDMEEGSFDAVDAWEEMDESARNNFESFEDFRKATENVTAGDLDEWFEKATGPQQKLRNSMSKLREAMSDLGQTFTEDVINSFTNFADTVTGLVEKFQNIDETVRSNISRFAVLATAIGLLLGPILFFAGQLAVMASVMGSSVLPVLGVLAVGFGVLASSFYSAIEGGEESASMFERMRNVFSGVIDFVLTLKDYFVAFLIPALVYLGDVFQDTFARIMSEFGDTGDISSFRTILMRVFVAIREGILSFAMFIDKNKELIAELTVLAVDVILNKVLPAVTELAKGLLAVIKDINWSRLASIAIPIIVAVGAAIVKLTKAVGLFLQNNSELIGSIITWVAILGAALMVGLKFLAFLGKVASVLGPVIAAFQAFWGGLSGLPLMLKLILTGFKLFGVVITKLVSIFSLAAKGLGVLYTILQAVAAAISFAAGVIGISVSAFLALIAVIGALIAAIWIARDNVVKGFAIIGLTVIKIINDIWRLLTGKISWKEAGTRIVDSLATGMLDGIKNLKNAAEKVVDTVAAYLPASPADEGPFSEIAPEEYGKNIAEYTAEGMLSGEGEVEGASTSLVDSSVPDTDKAEYSLGKDGTQPSKGMKDGKGRNMPKGASMGKDVTVEEGAITVGPFHGISDEELPEEVREQVQRSLQDLMEEIKGSGKDSTTSLASGDGL